MGFTQKLRNKKDENITATCFADKPWTRRYLEKEGNFEKVVMAIEKQFGRTEYAWQANVRFPDTLLSGKRLPNCSHGLNTFSHINNMAVLSDLNPTPEAARFLNNFYGLYDKQIHAAIQGEAFFQSIMR